MRPETDLRQRLDEILAEFPAGALTGTGPGTLADGDAWLLVRRVAEELDGTFSAEEYSEAASALRLLGLDADADSLASIARSSASLAKAEREWRDRYRDRTPTLTEQRDRALLASGRVRQLETGIVAGADGAVYTPAVLTGPAGATAPVVVAATHAGTVEVITGFRPGERRVWLTDRAGHRPWDEPAPVPMTACSAGPECRVVREERVLARLLAHGDPDGAIITALPPAAFSTHARSETYMAFLDAGPSGTPDLGAVRDRLATRLLLAPDWAASYIGRPCGHLALAYADRLAATPVTESQARSAVADLVRETGQEASVSSAVAARKPRRPSRSRPVSAHTLPTGGFPCPEPPDPGITLQP